MTDSNNNSDLLSNELSTPTTPVALTVEDEIAAARAHLAAMQQKQAEMEQVKLAAIKMQIAERNAEQERQAAAIKAEIAATEAKWAERRRLEKEERDNALRLEEQTRARLERELGEREEKARQAEKAAAELERLNREAYMASQEAERIASELARGTSLITNQEQDTPVTLEDSRHPLSMLFGRPDVLKEKAQQAFNSVPVVEEAHFAPERIPITPEQMKHLEWYASQRGFALQSIDCLNLLIWPMAQVLEAVQVVSERVPRPQGKRAVAEIEIELGRTK